MKNALPQNTITAFVSAAQDAFAGNLVGVYLHGSAAMNCYNPAVSDLDFIVVVERPIADDARRAFMQAVCALDSQTPGKGIEMSVVTRDACKPFAYPTPFELHWSRAHAAWYARDPEDYIAKMRGTDADLAAHFTVLRGRGVCLCGAPIAEVFAPVPEADYIDSIWQDVRDAEEEISENPVYLVLNLARVLAYLEDGAVLSKREGGEWALVRLPEHRPLIEAALAAYMNAEETRIDAERTPMMASVRTDADDTRLDADLARAYAKDVLLRIEARIKA